MKKIVLIAFALLHSLYAGATCFVGVYSSPDLDRFQPERITSAKISEERTDSFEETQMRLQAKFTFDGVVKVGEIKALCKFTRENSDHKTCKAAHADFSFGWNESFSNPRIREIGLPREATFLETTKGAPSGNLIDVPIQSRYISLDQRSNRCPSHYFERAHIKTTPRMWNELILSSIRKDFARPTVTARNLFHLSAALWDSYAVYSNNKKLYFSEGISSPDPGELTLEEAQNKTMSYAAYILLSERYKNAPGYSWNAAISIKDDLQDTMKVLGHSLDILAIGGPSDPAYVGIQIARNILKTQAQDGSREEYDYSPLKDSYTLINPTPLDMRMSGAGGLIDINHWQPLRLARSVDQSGNPTNWQVQPPLTLFWGQLPTFSNFEDQAARDKSGVFFDPGTALPTFENDFDKFIESNLQVVDFSSLLSPISGGGAQKIDVSPNSYGNNSLGSNDGEGYSLNPFTGRPYTPNFVKHANYGRTLAEFWADGPDSETPPGHWNTIANTVMDHPQFKWSWTGSSQPVNKTQYELQLYLTLNGALHDAAVVAWGIKGHYQGNRPISVVRRLAHLAESDSNLAAALESKSKNVRMVTEASSKEGMPHHHLKDSIGKLAIYAWRGEMTRADRRDLALCSDNPGSSRCPADPDQLASWKNGIGGAGWTLAENFVPYQRQTFVTPPFPGFVSGHSTFSRAAAEVLAGVTGDRFFPGGLGEFKAPSLVFEEGPTEDFNLQWATYYDAADQSGLSRIYGGIHAYYDDLPARKIGSQIGKRAVQTAQDFFK